MKRKKVYMITGAIALILLFFTSYYFISEEIKLRNNIENGEVDKAVYNEGEKALRDDLKISLQTGKKSDGTFTINDIKKKYNINETLSEEKLTDILAKDGYKLNKKEESTFLFNRNKEDSLEANTYYIGAKEDNLAIFKTDKDGKISVEETFPDTIYHLGDYDQEKIRNFEYFSSKDKQEVELRITELTT